MAVVGAPACAPVPRPRASRTHDAICARIGRGVRSNARVRTPLVVVVVVADEPRGSEAAEGEPDEARGAAAVVPA